MAKIKETATPCQSEEKEDDTLLLEQKEYATKIFNLSGFKIDLSSSSNSTKDIAGTMYIHLDIKFTCKTKENDPYLVMQLIPLNLLL